jgi:hypothetical protein
MKGVKSPFRHFGAAIAFSQRQWNFGKGASEDCMIACCTSDWVSSGLSHVFPPDTFPIQE